MVTSHRARRSIRAGRGDQTVTIKQARELWGITQQQMSDLLGIPKRTIENWEGGVNNPPTWAEKLIVAEIMRRVNRAE